MNYWKYRAYNVQLCIQEGVVVSPSDQAPDGVLLQLRQQGLQGIDIRPIDRAEYNREVYLRRLKERGQPQPRSVSPPGLRSSIRRGWWLGRAVASFFHRRNG